MLQLSPNHQAVFSWSNPESSQKLNMISCKLKLLDEKVPKGAKSENTCFDIEFDKLDFNKSYSMKIANNEKEFIEKVINIQIRLD